MISSINSLATELREFSEAFAEKVPERERQIMADAAVKVEQTLAAAPTLSVGDTAPDFVLPDAKGGQSRLSEALNDGPVVLTFYRGSWCPYCNLELRALEAARGDFEAAGARLVAVSPQTPDHSLSTAEKNELQYDVLSDVGNKVANEYGLVFRLPEELLPVYQAFGIDVEEHNGAGPVELPAPATFVIDSSQTVRFAFVNADYRQRAEPSEVLSALQGLSAS